MDSQESKQYWEECMNDSMVPKGPGLSNKGTDAVCISFALHSSFLLCSATLLQEWMNEVTQPLPSSSVLVSVAVGS